MNSKFIIKTVSEELGYAPSIVEEVYNAYWKDKKEQLSNEEYSSIVLEYLGKWEINASRVKTTLKYHTKQLEKLLDKLPSVESEIKYKNIVDHQKAKVEFLERIKAIHNL